MAYFGPYLSYEDMNWANGTSVDTLRSICNLAPITLHVQLQVTFIGGYSYTKSNDIDFIHSSTIVNSASWGNVGSDLIWTGLISLTPNSSFAVKPVRVQLVPTSFQISSASYYALPVALSQVAPRTSGASTTVSSAGSSVSPTVVSWSGPVNDSDKWGLNAVVSKLPYGITYDGVNGTLSNVSNDEIQTLYLNLYGDGAVSWAIASNKGVDSGMGNSASNRYGGAVEFSAGAVVNIAMNSSVIGAYSSMSFSSCPWATHFPSGGYSG